MRQNIYLGIDGVILTKGVIPALHLDKFLKHINAYFNVFWLSSRCRGSSEVIEKYLSCFLEPTTITLTRAIRPTSFSLDKTEAIDFNKDFFWIEPELFDTEKNMLKKHNKFNSWIKLDLIRSPNQLANLTNSKLLLQNEVWGR
ncbi:MAG: hypothetical protein UU23_C0003G0012 [Candidatus Curtissbacteria bacterium GW2011_GWA1_40_9]|uniref:Uncharacterized protein n=1 Tax=Candidatus Curtissbacteria bacterium GW2011_GWA1_40_9 TaxID=1618408 RepID=A0A0G0TM78_9BACT|nr:MAG: hypothetical protein UU23_C0003G0012 [Candidatus Curtissbacteria bacterium GW2011_GWA1_40_9]